MAQFRTVADILDEILQKAGESPNGNSPYESLALTYANKVHHAIIAGGNIFNLDVDEPWVWARSRHPMVLELQPAYTSGAVTCTNGDVNITFESASSTSLEGWHFQINGRNTVYKITQHTASSTTAQIDSSFLEDTGAYNFRAFKLEYEVIPAYVYIDNYNDRIDFQESTAATVSATLTHGAYTLSNYISHVASVLTDTGANTYVGTFDSVLRRYAITSSTAGGTIFNILGASGTNHKRSALPSLGLDTLNYTGAASYTSTYTPNSIARLIEPFKLFSAGSNEPFIYSSDPIKMQQDYPIGLTNEKVPDRFARISEGNDGSVWIRFNAYPKNKTKVALDWIPVPQDIQDNTASYVKLPRTDTDTLIHGAAAYIAFDKEDTKWESFLKLCGSGLQSMKIKNHSLLHRTGESFGQIDPRADLAAQHRRFDFGYTVTGSTAAATTAESTQSMISTTLTYADFFANATTASVTARTLPANRSLFALIVKHSEIFTGSSITALSLDVGIAGDPTKFINGFNPAQAVADSAQDSMLTLYFPAAATPILVRMTSTGADLSAMNQGSVTLYFQETIVT